MLGTSLFGRPPDHRGKVRDTYYIGDDRLLLVATDKISAFDVPFQNGVPRKGEVLTGISAHWLEKLEGWGIPGHLIAVIDGTNDLDLLGQKLPSDYYGRSTLVHRAKRVDAECIVRVCISGSGWSAYLKGEPICGVTLPEGLVESEMLPSPIFTPTKKDENDEPLTYEELEALVGAETARQCRNLSFDIVELVQPEFEAAGLLLADTKFEFGWRDGKLIVIDEVLTPDSSRIWPLAKYKPGGSQTSFDKQPVRDWMSKSGWKRGDPAPVLPDEHVQATTQRYLEAYHLITRKELVS